MSGWFIRFVALAALVLASGWASSARPEEVKPERAAAGSVLGPSRDALARRLPVAVAFASSQRGFLATASGQLLATADRGRTWHRVGPSARFVRLDFLTAEHGFALTAADSVLETRDGGRSWRTLHSFPRGSHGGLVGALHFVDQRHGFLAALDGRIYRTADGGRAWTQLPFRCGFVLGGVAFLDQRRGLAVCGGQPATDMQMKELYTTGDGGASWQRRARTTNRPTNRGGLPWVGFADGLALVTPQVAFMSAGRAGVYGTADAGRSWHTVLFTDDTFDVQDMDWLSPAFGYVVLSGSGLAATTDGGKHWRQLYPKPPGPPQGPVAFSSQRRGIGAATGGLFGDTRAIVASEDAGASWENRGVVPNVFSVSQLVRVSASRVWAVASTRTRLGPGHVRLLRSDDDGRHWRLVEDLPGESFATLSFPTGHVGFLAGSSGRLYRTADGGATWPLRAHGRALGSVVFLSTRDGFAIGLRAAPGERPPLLATHDGGLSWQEAPIAVAGFRPLALTALGPEHAWITGGICLPTGRVVPGKGPECKPRGGAVLETADGGRHWQLIRLPIVLGAQGLDFVTRETGFVNDQFEGFYRTTDGGRTWRSPQTSSHP